MTSPLPGPIPAPDRLQVPVTWGPVTGTPAAANHVALQALDDGIMLLTFGFAGPPILIGTVEQQIEQLQNVKGVEIQPIAQFTLPARIVAQLADIFAAAATAMAGQPDAAPSTESRPA